MLRFAGFFPILQLIACVRGEPSQLSVVAQRFDDFSRAEHRAARLPDEARAAAVSAAYEDAFAFPRDRQNISTADLDLLFRAAQMTAFQTLTEHHVRDLLGELTELERRGTATKRHYLHLQTTLIKARRLDQARDLTRRHPELGLEEIPELRDADHLMPGQVTEWAVERSELTLVRRSVDLVHSTRLLVVSHPRCHFATAAVRDIESDPELGRVFREHAKWLAPQGGSLSVEAIRKWNRDHPGQETTLTVHREEWPMIDSWNTPTFYVLQNGAVQAKVEGWSREGRREELVAALERVGLL